MSASGYHDPPCPVHGIEAVEVDGELVLYDPASNRAVYLDQRATLIWGVLDGSVTVDDVVGDLCEAFGAPEGAVRPDVDAMLWQLYELGFLEPAGRSASVAPSTVLADPPSP